MPRVILWESYTDAESHVVTLLWEIRGLCFRSHVLGVKSWELYIRMVNAVMTFYQRSVCFQFTRAWYAQFDCKKCHDTSCNQASLVP